MKYPLILLCSAALLPAAAMANEGDKSANKDDTFSSLDKDSDGRLSQEEVAGHSGLSANFAALDGNSDGYVTKAEFRRNTMPKKDTTGRPY